MFRQAQPDSRRGHPELVEGFGVMSFLIEFQAASKEAKLYAFLTTRILPLTSITLTDSAGETNPLSAIAS